MRRHVPNLLTCANLVSGAAGIVYLFKGDGDYPIALFVWIAAIFDFFDGFAARLLNVKSDIGKELDSLADMVSFGLLPSLFIFTLIDTHSPGTALAYASFLIAVCSALRLAKFNIDDTQQDSFTGLPTPANALFLTALPYLRPEAELLFTPIGLAAIAVVFSWLLVSPIRLFALKFKDFSWPSNKVRFTFLIISVLLLILLHFAAIPLIIILYILLSLGVWLGSRK